MEKRRGMGMMRRRSMTANVRVKAAAAAVRGVSWREGRGEGRGDMAGGWAEVGLEGVVFHQGPACDFEG